jgi:glycine/serine hydroxymethyltransferase
MGEAEMDRIAELIDQALTHPSDDRLERIRREVETLASGFPLYAEEPTVGVGPA